MPRLAMSQALGKIYIFKRFFIILERSWLANIKESLGFSGKLKGLHMN